MTSVWQQTISKTVPGGFAPVTIELSCEGRPFEPTQALTVFFLNQKLCEYEYEYKYTVSNAYNSSDRTRRGCHGAERTLQHSCYNIMRASKRSRHDLLSVILLMLVLLKQQRCSRWNCVLELGNLPFEYIRMYSIIRWNPIGRSLRSCWSVSTRSQYSVP